MLKLISLVAVVVVPYHYGIETLFASTFSDFVTALLYLTIMVLKLENFLCSFHFFSVVPYHYGIETISKYVLFALK